MPLVSAVIVPHTPSLFTKQGDCTAQHAVGLADVKNELQAARPDVILSISAHLVSASHSFIFQVAETYIAGHEAIGDLSHTVSFPGALPLLFRWKESLETSFAISLLSDGKLDPSLALPLFLLYDGLNAPTLIPIGSSLASAPLHFDFGRALADLIHASTQRLACVVSADLSHRHATPARRDFSERAAPFDAMINDLLQPSRLPELMHLDEEQLEVMQECAVKPLLILAGLLTDANFNGQLLHSGVSNGVGHTMAVYKLR